MKVYSVSVVLLVVVATCLVTEARSFKSRALRGLKEETSEVDAGSQQVQIVQLLKALQKAIKGLPTTGAATTGATDESDSGSRSTAIGLGQILIGTSTTTTPSPSTTAAATTEQPTSGDSESRGLGSLLGNRGSLSKILISIIKTLLSQTPLGSGSSEMSIDLTEFINIVDALLGGLDIL